MLVSLVGTAPLVVALVSWVTALVVVVFGAMDPTSPELGVDEVVSFNGVLLEKVRITGLTPPLSLGDVAEFGVEDFEGD